MKNRIVLLCIASFIASIKSANHQKLFNFNPDDLLTEESLSESLPILPFAHQQFAPRKLTFPPRVLSFPEPEPSSAIEIPRAIVQATKSNNYKTIEMTEEQTREKLHAIKNKWLPELLRANPHSTSLQYPVQHDIGGPMKRKKYQKQHTKRSKIDSLYYSFPNSLAGMLCAIADETHLYALKFVPSNEEIAKFLAYWQKKLGAQSMTSQATPLLMKLEQELIRYSNSTTRSFTIPYKLTGTRFQLLVWKELEKLEKEQAGASYKYIATQIGSPESCRAVANAVGANPLHIILPCHRIVGSNGDLGGYKGGVEKKKQLLQHESFL